MHAAVVFVYLCGVGLRSKASEAFLEHVNPERLVGSDKDVDAQVELVSIYQQWVGYVAADNAKIVYINIIDIVYQINALSLTTASRLNNPDVFLRVVLPQLLVVSVKLPKLIR